MSAYKEFEDRLAALFTLELRRQGVPEVDAWVGRLRTYCRYVPTTHSYDGNQEEVAQAHLSASRPTTAGTSSCVFVLDMSDVHVGDRPAVALCESLLKVEGPHGRLASTSVAEWHLLWRHCGLTDRALHHLALLVSGCAKLTVLDVSSNGFSPEGQSELLAAAAEGPCDVIVAATEKGSGAVHQDAHGGENAEHANGSFHQQDSLPSSPALSASAPPYDTYEPPSRSQPPPLQASSRGADATTRPPPPATSGPAVWKSSGGEKELPKIIEASSPLLSSGTQPKIRQLRRSPSLTATSTSVTPSQRSYASGSAEALQRRREELFGRSATATAAPAATAGAALTNSNSNLHQPSSPSGGLAAATASKQDEAEIRQLTKDAADQQKDRRSTVHMSPSRVERNADNNKNSSPTNHNDEQNARSDAAHRDENGTVSPRRTLQLEGQASERVASPLVPSSPLQRNTVAGGKPAIHNDRVEEEEDEAEEEGAYANAVQESPLPLPPSDVVGSHSPFRTTQTAAHSSSGHSHSDFTTPSPQRRARGGKENNAGAATSALTDAAAASREPFEDRNDQLDLTANLSPVLDSVLDLSALMTRNGQLRQAHMFGGAQTVWDVLNAYEDAAEQQCTSTQNGSGVIDAALLSKLPAALLGHTTFSAITVLNLSRNHLRSLCAMPATLLRLDVSCNELTELSGLHTCRMLTVLNARRNQLRVLRGLERNLSIAHLFLGHNAISMVEGLAHLVLLETLDLTFNNLRTQTSIRMLSLCAALRHLLIRGNPVVESNSSKSSSNSGSSSKAGFTAVLRNLCPTLLVVDDQRIANPKLADRAMQHRNWGTQPNLLDAPAHPSSRYADPSTRQSGRGTMRSAGQSSPMVTSSAVLSHTAVGLLTNAQLSSGRGGEEGTLNTEHVGDSSLPFTASRRRAGSRSGTGTHRPAPFASNTTAASLTLTTQDGMAMSAADAVDSQSMELLQMLTRGVTAPTGYGDAARSQHAAQHFARLQKAAAEKARVQQERQLTANGRPIRGAVVKQLAEESRRYVEETIVRRMTAPQQQQLISRSVSSALGELTGQVSRNGSPAQSRGKGGGGGRGASPTSTPRQRVGNDRRDGSSTENADGGVTSPARSVSPPKRPPYTTSSVPRATSPFAHTNPNTTITTTTAAAAAAAAASADVDPATAEVLRRYALRTKPIKRNTSVTPHVAMTHAAELRAASSRRQQQQQQQQQQSVSPSRSRPQSPARSPSSTASPPFNAARDADRDVRGGRGPGGRDGRTQKSSSPSSSQPRRTSDDRAAWEGGVADATLDAVYIEDMPRRDTVKDAAFAGGDGAAAATSYAALHMAEQQQQQPRQHTAQLDEAEIECSPISKDPQARLVTSLNTTASVFERSEHREVSPQLHRPPPPPPLQRSESLTRGRQQNVYAPPPQGTGTATMTAIPAPTRHASSSPARTAQISGSSSGSNGAAGGVRDREPQRAATTHVIQSSADHQERHHQRPHEYYYYDPGTVEETAIYPASRSGSRVPRSDAAAASLTRAAHPRAPSPAAQVHTRASIPHSSNPAVTPAVVCSSAAVGGRDCQHLPRSLSREGRRASNSERPAINVQPSTSPSTSPRRSRSGSLSPSTQPQMLPLHIDAAQRTRVRAWAAELAEDAASVQETLVTLVELLEAQRQPTQPLPESSRELPQTYLQERQRCLEIVTESGMLADTQVPMDVVVYYGLAREELNGEEDRSALVVPRDRKSEAEWQREVAERAEVLRLVHLLGDAKTCLRYVSLLIGDGRERLLQQYVDQLKDSLRA